MAKCEQTLLKCRKIQSYPLSEMSNKNNIQTWHKDHGGTYKRKRVCQILGCVN